MKGGKKERDSCPLFSQQSFREEKKKTVYPALLCAAKKKGSIGLSGEEKEKEKKRIRNHRSSLQTFGVTMKKEKETYLLFNREEVTLYKKKKKKEGKGLRRIAN